MRIYQKREREREKEREREDTFFREEKAWACCVASVPPGDPRRESHGSTLTSLQLLLEAQQWSSPLQLSLPHASPPPQLSLPPTSHSQLSERLFLYARVQFAASSPASSSSARSAQRAHPRARGRARVVQRSFEKRVACIDANALNR